MTKLPDTWIAKEIGEVAEIVTGSTPSRKNDSYFGGNIPWVKPPDINKSKYIFESDEYLTDQGAAQARLIPAGSIMVTCIGNIGNVAIAGVDLATNQQINSIVVDEEVVLSKYVFYQALTWKAWLNENSTSTTIALLNKSRFSKAPLLIAPLPEQKRIVTKLDTLFGHLDQLKVRLEKIPDLLKQLRQGVLTQAVTGKLTEEWREKNKVTDDWQERKLDQVGEVSGGLTLNSTRKLLVLKMPYLRVGNVYSNEIILDEIKTIGVAEKEISRVLLKKGDLLIVEGNGSPDQIGRVALWNGEIENCLHQNHLIKFRNGEAVIPKYVLYYLISFPGRKQIEEASKSTSGLYTLSLSKVSNLEISVPPLIEQKEIVRRVESLFDVADRIEASYKTLQEKIDQLPQAILSKAFRGELVGNEMESVSMAAEENEKYFVRGKLK